MTDEPASDKQVRYALDLIYTDLGIAPHTVVNAQIARRYNIPQGDVLREVLKSLDKHRISALIDRLKGDD